MLEYLEGEITLFTLSIIPLIVNLLGKNDDRLNKTPNTIILIKINRN